jgi:hypothetical protein
MPPQAPITVPLNVSAPVTFSPAVSMAVLQHASATAQYVSGTGAASVASFTNNTTPGSCLVACFTIISEAGITTLNSVTTNGKTENWAKAVTDSNSQGFIYINPNTGGGQKSIVINWSFGGTAGATTQCAVMIDIFEVSGLPVSAILDQIAATAISDTTTFSATTPVTTSPIEIWFAMTMCVEFTASTQPTITGPGAPWNLEPQLNTSANTGGTVRDYGQVSGYQIVNAKAAATWAGTVTESGGGNGGLAIVATLVGSGYSGGAGTAQIGPANHREVWYPEVISVSASSNVHESTCNIYAGPDSTQENFVDSTTTGSTGFSTYPTTNRQVKCGEYVFAVWNGGDGGAQGRLVIVGTKVLNSGGPPGWTHARTRRP